jgi:aminoglycoside/choline kinase family phosphotransferase
MDDRQQLLSDWASGQLPDYTGPSDWECVAGDASSRRYFRLRRQAQSWICVDSPPQTEKNTEFLQVRDLLDARGVCVPDLVAADAERGLLLLGDLGDRQLLDLLSETSVDRYYTKALATLRQIYTGPIGAGQLPPYDEAVLSEELSRFPQWFCDALLNCPLDDGQQQVFHNCSQLLIRSALEQPRVFVHRDFHSRNLLVQAGGELGVIDFQDALLGAVTYDAASLLKDCYIRWPRPQVEAWLEQHRQALVAEGMQGLDDGADFLRWFDWIGLQRHLKVLGTFARLYLRDGKDAYLHDLPLVLSYVREVLGLYPKFDDMRGLFGEHLDPVIAEQRWSSSS